MVAGDDASGPVAEYLATPARQAGTLRETAHRPWPLPARQWVMAQTWDVLLFAHWPLPYEDVRRHVPDPLPLDTFDGSAWIGITPFVLTGLRPVAFPPLPHLSTFPELNVRTYVTVGGRPGIYFFSLDAASRGAVAAARRFYRLPYFHARMTAERSDGAVAYESRRKDRRGHQASFRARYGQAGPAARASPGSLEYFLTERYCLYAVAPDGRLLRAEIHHPPWELRPAEAELAENTMPPPSLTLPRGAPLLPFSERQDVVIWSPAPVEEETA